MSGMSERERDPEEDAPPSLHQPPMTPYLIELSWAGPGCCDVDVSLPTLRLGIHLHVHGPDEQTVTMLAMREIMLHLSHQQRPRGAILN